MIVRGIDTDGDWMFGKGRNDYLKNNAAVAQNIKTRLQSFLGDCFFALNAGLDWFNLLGSKNQLALSLAVSSSILNTRDVTAIVNLTFDLSANRAATLHYSVETVYGRLNQIIQQNLG